MSTQRQYDTLTYVVGMRLTDLGNQQLRATALAAADGVLVGFIATVSAVDTGLARQFVLGALIVLSLAIVAATVAVWPANAKAFGTQNPALAGDDQTILDDICAELSAVLIDPRMARVKTRRNYAIGAQLVLSGIALALLVLSAFVFAPPPAHQ